MKRGILAQEELGEINEAPTQTSAEFEQAANDLLESADRVEEASGLSEAVENSSAAIEKAVDNDTVSDDMLVAVESFYQHATKRLGVKPVRFGIESNDSAETKKQKAKRVAVEMRQLSQAVNQRLSVAIEDNAVAMRKFADANEKMANQTIADIHRAVTESNEKKGASKEVLTGSWVKNLGSTHDIVKADDVVKTVKTMEQGLKKLGAAGLRLADLVKEAIREMRKTWFFSSSENVENLEGISSEVNKISEQIVQQNLSNSSSTQAQALSSDEAKHLGDATVALFGVNEFDRSVNEIFSEANWGIFWSWLNNGWRLKTLALSFVSGGLSGIPTFFAEILPGNGDTMKKARQLILADDVAGARNASEDARAAAHNLIKLGRDRQRLGSAVLSYIEQSTRVR